MAALSTLEARRTAVLEWATEFARNLLEEPLPRRWSHSLGVLRAAQRIAPALGDDAELLAAAAILHDVGYADVAIATHQHMIDGGRFLRSQGVDDRICVIVAHHTSSPWEAHELGLDAALAEFVVDDPALIDAITYCDLSAGPTGDVVRPADRLAEVLERYGEGHVVYRAVSAARSHLLEACMRVETRLASTSSTA
jgi:putative nucleotidyltransferase with HDIG domain